MRRDINIRKRKKILMGQLNKKSFQLLCVLIILLLLAFAFYIFFVQGIFVNKNLEKDSTHFSDFNDNVPFHLGKVVLFNSATAEDNSVNQRLSLDISEFCDIGIYIYNSDPEKNSVKSVSISDISISAPEIGKPCLYQKHIKDFGKCTFSEENIIGNELSFPIVDPSSLNEEQYELANDFSTPITLGYYNQNIKQGFIVENEEVVYNGTLLKTAFIPQSSLNTTIAFAIHITTNTDEEYLCNISFELPFEDENGSLYDTGYVTKEINGSLINSFIRIR